MTGKDLKLSGTQADFDPTTGGPIVTMQFTGKGNKLFHEITRAEAQRGQQLGDRLQSFAIVLDNQIYSFPTIDYTQYADGIDPTGGGAADHRARVAEGGEATSRSCSRPARCPCSSSRSSARTSRRRSARTRCARRATPRSPGLIVVALFLLLLYRFLGLVAVIGLAIYAAFMYGAILLLGVTLTLPGFAGLILTIGVAADANVVIFERIKEEARAGQIGARRDRRRATRRASARSSTRTSSRRSPP